MKDYFFEKYVPNINKKLYKILWIISYIVETTYWLSYIIIEIY